MLLKKQTVWLLTMLSLVVVLSVYYITSPEPQNGNLASLDSQEKTDEKGEEAGEEPKEESGKNEADGAVISKVENDEQFDALRLDLEDQRSQRKAELQAIVASTDLPVDQRNQAFDEMKELDTISNKESVLETLIKSMGYEDALVRADGEKVRITIKAEEHTPAEANEIIQMVRSELGSLQAVAVTFQPEK